MRRFMVVREERSITLNAKVGGGHAFHGVDFLRFQDCLFFDPDLRVSLLLIIFGGSSFSVRIFSSKLG